mgnify:CR=1 FL=1
MFGLICWWWCKGGLTSETFSLCLYSLRNGPKTYLEHLLFRWFGTFFWRWKNFLRSNHPNVCDVLVRKSQKMKQPRCWHFLSVHHTHFLLLHQMSKTSLDKRLSFLIISFYRHEYNVNESIHVFGGKCQVLNTKVCFKKTLTIHNSDTVLCIVTLFLKQTLSVNFSPWNSLDAKNINYKT